MSKETVLHYLLYYWSLIPSSFILCTANAICLCRKLTKHNLLYALKHVGKTQLIGQLRNFLLAGKLQLYYTSYSRYSQSYCNCSFHLFSPYFNCLSGCTTCPLNVSPTVHRLTSHELNATPNYLLQYIDTQTELHPYEVKLK